MSRSLLPVVAPVFTIVLAACARAEGPSASELPAAPAAPSADACARLTPDALASAESAVGGLAASAEAALAAHGAGNYPGAMKHALDELTASREKLQSLRSWLSENGVAAPHVSNTTAAYNVAGYAREALTALDVGRHWVSVATAYDRLPEGRVMLGDAAKVHAIVADVESDGLTCYVSAYVP